jgi:hypothetical protein
MGACRGDVRNATFHGVSGTSLSLRAGAILLILIAGLFQCCSPPDEHVHIPRTNSSQVTSLRSAGISVVIKIACGTDRRYLIHRLCEYLWYVSRVFRS